MEICPHTEGAQHDCMYVRRRDALIPEAERLAHQRAENGTPGAWTREFFRAMDELARDHGVVGGGPMRAAA